DKALYSASPIQRPSPAAPSRRCSNLPFTKRLPKINDPAEQGTRSTPDHRRPGLDPGAVAGLLRVEFFSSYCAAHCSPFTTHCSPLTAHHSLLTAHCSPRLPPNRKTQNVDDLA